MDETIYKVAIDDGFARIKLVGESPDGGLVQLDLPSSIRSGAGNTIGSVYGDEQKIGFYKTEEGISYTVSPNIAGENTRIPDFHLSQMDRVLVNHALVEAGYAGKKVFLMTSLPVNEFYRDGNRDGVRIRSKMANLQSKGITAIPDTKPMPIITKVRVGCQALAAYFDLTLDAAGELQSSNVNTMAVIDIGGSTTDIAVILEGDTIDQGRLGSLKLGVLDVHAEIQRLFDKKFERMEYPSKVMERAIRFKKIKLHGVDHDVSALVDEAITTVSYRLKNEIGIILGNTALLDKVFFVGGGAAVFNDIAAGWHNASVAENPGFANARGLFKYSLRPA